MNELNHTPDKSNPLLNQLHEGVWILDKESDTTFVNQTFAEMLGYSVSEMVGKHFMGFLHESYLSTYRQIFEQIKKGSTEIIELLLIKKNDDCLQAIFNMSPMFSLGDTFTGVVIIVYNVSIKNQKQSFSSLDKIGFSKIFYDAPLGTCVVLPNGKFADVNDAFLQITGYSREEIFNIPIQDLTHPDDREMNLKFVNKVLNNTLNDYELEKRYLRKDGVTFWAQMYVRVVRDSQKVLLYSIVMIKEITENKELREKLIDSERMAEIGKMLSHLSHAIKSPLSVIGMNVDFLKHQCADKNCFNPILPIIQNELKHIDYLIQEVLIYSRHNHLHRINFNIREKVENIITEMHPILETQNIRIINNIDNKIINADSQKIYSLLLTLIDNSIEAIGQNGTIEFFSECSDKNDFIDIFIRDTGVGFNDPENAFKPFYTTKSTGTGMGLPIAKNLVQDHKGSIELMCAEPGDTIIKFSLPLAGL